MALGKSLSLRDILLVAWQFPLLLATRLPAVRDAVERDVQRQIQPRLDLPLPDAVANGERAHALRHRPLRTILYVRMVNAGGIAEMLARLLLIVYHGEPAMSIGCETIGPGLLAMHGFATIVLAGRIGRDCQLAQQVTVGYSDKGGPPVLGDRVRLGANSVVIGPITIGDDAVVGAGAVVVADVPAGAVVGGVPARVLESAEDRFGARHAAAP